MQIALRTSGCDLAPALRTLVEQHFWFAIRPFKKALAEVHVTMSDSDEAGMVPAKRCQVEIQLRNGKSLMVEQRDPRAETAVGRAAKSVFRLLDNRQRRRRARSVLTHVA